MKVDLLGTSFTLQSDEDPEYLRQLTDYYARKIEEIQDTVSTSDPVKLAILAGILVADELFKNHTPIVNQIVSQVSQPPSPSPGSVLQTGGGEPLLNREELEEAERITLDLISTIDLTLESASLDASIPPEKT